MFRTLCLAFCCLCLMGAQAFMAAAPMTQQKALRSAPSTVVRAGYVPDGISEADWKKLNEEKAKKAAENKKRVSSKKFVDIADWLKERDQKYPGQIGAGHTFAKVKNFDNTANTPRAAAFINKKK